MTTAQYIKTGRSKQAQKAKRLMMMHLQLPHDIHVKALLKQAIQSAEQQRILAEAELDWFLLED